MTTTPPGFPSLLRATLLAALLAGSVAGCAPGARRGDVFEVREITPGFLLPLEARDPVLAADARGNVALSWVSGDAAHAAVWLAVSRDTGESFAAPVQVNPPGTRVASTPGQPPAIAIGRGGALAVAWSEPRGDSSGAVDLRVRASADLGRTFADAVTVNDDVAGPPPGSRWRQRHDWPLTHRPDAAHGLPALAFTADGSLFAAWLDDRRTPQPLVPRLATLWGSISADGGQTWAPNAALRDSVSRCSRPTLAIAADGALALAYRDGANDVRDPRLALSFDGGRTFTTDTLVSRDGWRRTDCPDQGTAVVWEPAGGGLYAWFNGTSPAGVYAARWRRGGGMAGPRRPAADSLANAGTPLLASLGEAVLIAIPARAAGDSSRHVLAVRLLSSGEWSEWTFLGANAGAAAVASAGLRRAVACWVEHDAAHDRLRLAMLAPRPRGRR